MTEPRPKRHWRCRLAWLFAGAIAIAVVFEVGRAIPLVAPGLFFEHEATFPDFDLYSDAPLDSSWPAILAESRSRLRELPLRMDRDRSTLIVCQTVGTYRWMARLVGRSPRSQGFNVHLLGTTVLSMPYIQWRRRQARPEDAPTLLNGTTAHVIAHEIVHQRCGAFLGYWRYRNLPTWVREGVAEYGAARNWRAANGWPLERMRTAWPEAALADLPEGLRPYIRGHLMVVWLVEVEGMALTDLLNTSPDAGAVWKRMGAKSPDPF